MKNWFLLLAFSSTQVFAADVRPTATAISARLAKSYQQLRKLGNSPTATPWRVDVAQRLMDLDLPESSLLFLYGATKSADQKTWPATIRALDRASVKTGETSLYRLLPKEEVSKLQSGPAHEFMIDEEIKKNLAAHNFEGAKAILKANDNIPLWMPRYRIADAYAQVGQATEAKNYFQDLNSRIPENSDDRKKGLAQLGVARAAYEEKNWPEAIALYRQVPKDSPFYRRALLELSWSLFRSGRFRSALSPLQTLHSDFYTGFFQPESLYLRSLIHLFICRYADAAQVYNSFQKNYRSAYFQMQEWTQTPRAKKMDLEELFIVADAVKNKSNAKMTTQKLHLPYFVIRTVVDEPTMNVLLTRHRALLKERKRIDERLRNVSEPLRAQLAAFMEKRLQRNRDSLLDELNNDVVNMKADLEQWFTLMDLMHLEIVGGLKDIAHDKMISPDKTQDISAPLSRQIFIQNGYRFWPFEGEYWRDEIGNYQFLGRSACQEEKP